MPNPSDFDDAIQNPKHCFDDASLQGGKVILNKKGRPWVASGNFASVYKFIDKTDKQFALRCFLHRVTDQKKRYQILSVHLQQHPILSLAKFDYLEKGIRVGMEWCPILKMEWVDGQTLNEYVEKNLDNPTKLAELMTDFRHVAKTLCDVQMAHGDLQHGNILVTDQGKIRLVDYDGMFLPEIAKICGEKSPELGHPNYQHPLRSRTDFNKDIDNFSVLVIYLSLRALYQDPSLWKDFNTEENLIFSAENYKNKSQWKGGQGFGFDPLWKRLLAGSDKGLKALTRMLLNTLDGPINKVPTLNEIIDNFSPLPRSQPIPHSLTLPASSSIFSLTKASSPGSTLPPSQEVKIKVTDITGCPVSEIKSVVQRTGWKATRKSSFYVKNTGESNVMIIVTGRDEYQAETTIRLPCMFRLFPGAYKWVEIFIPFDPDDFRDRVAGSMREKEIVIIGIADGKNEYDREWVRNKNFIAITVRLTIEKISWCCITPKSAGVAIIAFLILVYFFSMVMP